MTARIVRSSSPGVDQGRIESAVAEIIAALGEDGTREGLQGTPSRVAKLYADVFSGLAADPVAELQTGFDEGYDEMVVARDVTFFSMCEHHFLPFFGVAHIGYIPRGRVAGISKLARVVDVLGKRPQLQERLTAQIADAIAEGLDPLGVGVILEAQHLCMMMRGVRKADSKIVTSVNRGCFRTDARSRGEFLSLVGRG